jgi:DNA-binding NtrC family response regulator
LTSHNSKSRRRILLVDDEFDLTTVFKSALERSGYDVVTYNSAREALACFKPDQYDLAIFDVRMPGMGGFELFSKIRKIDSGIKALFVTAYANYEHEFLVTLPDLDIRCVLQKPLHMKQLQDTVEEVLGDKDK